VLILISVRKQVILKLPITPFRRLWSLLRWNPFSLFQHVLLLFYVSLERYYPMKPYLLHIFLIFSITFWKVLLPRVFHPDSRSTIFQLSEKVKSAFLVERLVDGLWS